MKKERNKRMIPFNSLKANKILSKFYESARLVH